MLITPQTTIKLMDTKLTEDNENQLWFSSQDNQLAYFEGVPSLLIENCTYQRDGTSIRVPYNIEQIRHYNYCEYKNQAYTNKTFFAFITGMSYLNENTTLVNLKTDVWQTYMFNLILQPCFVEREHVDDDGFGKNTIPENLEIGPPMIQEVVNMDWADPDKCLYCMQVSDFPTGANITDVPIRIYNGMVSGTYFLVFLRNNSDEINKWINAYVNDQKQDAIIALFPIPAAMAYPPTTEAQIQKLTSSISSNTYIFKEGSGSPYLLASYQIPSSFGNLFEGYQPKNNKLYTYPYCYFYLDTFAGSTVEYRYEDFSGGPVTFDLMGTLTTGGEFRVVPHNLRNSQSTKNNNAYGMTMASMPLGSWNNDTYNNWRALNMDAINIDARTDAISSFLSTGSDIWNLNLIGAAQNEVEYQGRVARRMNQVKVASKMPNQARGDTGSRNLNWSFEAGGGAFYRMSIKGEYAKKIDDYFSAFGYQVNSFKVPNVWGRKNWNFVKTLGANIVGNLPQEAIIELKECLDRGITFWHNPATMLDYTQPNRDMMDD